MFRLLESSLFRSRIPSKLLILYLLTTHICRLLTTFLPRACPCAIYFAANKCAAKTRRTIRRYLDIGPRTNCISGSFKTLLICKTLRMHGISLDLRYQDGNQLLNSVYVLTFTCFLSSQAKLGCFAKR